MADAEYNSSFIYQSGDECAQEVIVEHGGRNVTFSGNLRDIYSLEVNPSLMYDFTMYLKLADGHEMVLWNGELVLTAPTTTHFIAYSCVSSCSCRIETFILEYMGLKCSMVD